MRHGIIMLKDRGLLLQNENLYLLQIFCFNNCDLILLIRIFKEGLVMRIPTMLIKSKYIAKILAKMRIPSFDNCEIDKTCNISYESALAKVKMDRYSYLAENTTIIDAHIGAFCSIGGYVRIGGGIHPMNTVSMSPVFLKGRNFLRKHYAEIPYDSSETVYIGNDVWIGTGAWIKSGIKIGDGAVIGAHAVVTHDVEPYAVMVGVPAQMIKKRFNDDMILKLLKIKWWNWSDEKLKKIREIF